MDNALAIERPVLVWPKQSSLLVLAPLPVLIAIALAVRAYADRAAEHIVPYLGTYYAQQTAAVEQLHWWQLLLPLPQLDGRWGPAGFLLVHWLETVFGEPRSFYLLTAIAVSLGYLITWAIFRSLLMAVLVGIGLATTTFNYHVYAVSGSVIFLPLISFLFVSVYCQVSWLRTIDRGWFWGGACLASCVLFALSYEGWLDAAPLAWIIYPGLAWHFKQSGEMFRSRRSLLLLAMASLVAVLYIAIKVRYGLNGLHPRGGEADLLLTYGKEYKILMLEDVLSSFMTFFYTTITTYLPPEIFSFSLSSWLYGPEKIVALQEGYHPQATRLAHSNHLFLWRYYAGFALAVFLLAYWKVVCKFFRDGDAHHLILFVLMTGTLAGSATHLIIKWRPMHAAPLLGYQVYLPVMAWTVLLCYLAARACATLGGKRAVALGSLVVLNFFYCAYARPSLLSHMSKEVFLGTYPDPRQNLGLPLLWGH